MIDVDRILSTQKKNISDWHIEVVKTENSAPWCFIEENNFWNFSLWHEEDIARIKNIEPIRMVQAKRAIDQYNQSRNDSMEKIDEWILNYLRANKIQSQAKIHSETPGMMIDRLSIMHLKLYHMIEQTERKDIDHEHMVKCQGKALLLEEQIDDLSKCLRDVLKNLDEGKLTFKVYRQFKMYNDPSLNPKLYEDSTI